MISTIVTQLIKAWPHMQPTRKDILRLLGKEFDCTKYQVYAFSKRVNMAPEQRT